MMTVDEITDLAAYCTDLAQRAARAARTLANVPGALKNEWLRGPTSGTWRQPQATA